MKGHSDGQSTITKLLILLRLILILVNQAYAYDHQPSFLYSYCQQENANYTTNTTTFTSIFLPSSHINGHRFSNSSSRGRQMTETGLCRGDTGPASCRRCLGRAVDLLAKACPDHADAAGWLDKCMVHYSNRSTSGLVETRPRFHSWSAEKADPGSAHAFFLGLVALLDELKNRASSGGPLMKYSAGNASVGSRTVYALAQCVPDLSAFGCKACLDNAFAEIGRFYVRIGGRVATPSCNFRYEVYLFYRPADGNLQDTAPWSPPLEVTWSARSSQARNTKFSSGIIAVSIASASVVLIIFAGVYTRVKKGNKSVASQDSQGGGEEIEIPKCLKFDLSTIRVATNNFSAENCIRQSMICPVYKGRLFNGQSIAVKKFNKSDIYARDYFRNEVNLAAKVRHRNLVKLIGFGSEGREIFLVYEFVSTSLDLFLFDRPEVKGTHLSWERRYDIIKGVARGLLYLHKDSGLRIIHRDIRASKILLDEEMNPKISGFGTANAFVADQSGNDSNFPHKTISLKGYIAPEFLLGGLISDKSDVFSFGVLLLEIVTGRRNGFPYQGEPVDSSVINMGRLFNGQSIAVKKFNKSDIYARDYFRNEVNLAAKVRHQNLVKLIGFGSEGREIFLVYEFVSTSLDLFLFDRPEVKGTHLSWERRYDIIKGIARGLLYLHDDSGLRIIHRDIRASKILLDEEMNPKISGFGTANAFVADQSRNDSNFPHKTISLKGYIAPEFLLGGLISDKSDVFSFGMLLLEIVTGRRNGFPYQGEPVDSSVINMVWRNWKEERSLDIVSPQVKDGFECEIKRCINIGLLCIQENKDLRPTMNVVAQMLSCHCFSLAVPSPPAYSTPHRRLN